MSLRDIVKDNNARVIDVRSYIEFKMDHIEGASNIPLDQLPARLHEIESFQKGPIVVYCRSGNRSEQAVVFLRQHGVENVYNGGGIEELKYLLKKQAC